MIESHEYQVTLTSDGPKTGFLDSDRDGLPRLKVATPPEFGGPGEVWSPEHLFVASVSSCLMTTFYAIAQISGLEVLEYRDDPIGHLQRGDDRLYRIDRITLRPTVVVADDSKITQAVKLLGKAEEVCLIGRSVSSEIEVHPKVIAPQRVDVNV